VRITAKVDYAVRAMCELAGQGGGPVRGERLAAAQAIPQSFLENILHELKRAGLVATQRGVDGGYRLAKPAEDITVADIIRAVEGPLADVRGARPDSLAYEGSASSLRDVWLAVRANLRAVLELVTVADIAEDHLPELVPELLKDPEALRPH
jgi:Rrf2 family protein